MRSKIKHRNSLFIHVELAVNRSINRLNLLCTPQDTAHADRLNEALVRLRSAIVIKNNLEDSIQIKSTHGLSKETIDQMILLSYDEMLDVEISGLPSLKTTLEQCGRFVLIENELMSYGYTRPTSAARLCQLARVGDLTTLRTCIFSAYQLNKLVSWAILDLNGPPTYLGTYNALMIAASYRQFEVVKYFVEEKKANLSIKGGRSHHLTAKDCATMSSWFFQDVDERIVNYLNHPRITYGVSQHSFMAPPSIQEPKAMETPFEWELVVKPPEQFSL